MHMIRNSQIFFKSQDSYLDNYWNTPIFFLPLLYPFQNKYG